MPTQPKVSVIIPCYNVAPYLRKCLGTIANQTLQEIEIICINDGSTDETALILDEYAKKDERIIVIHQDNQGVSVARNVGIKLAKGEYVGFVDPDDWVDLNFYEKLYKATEKNKYDIVKGNYQKYEDQKGTTYTKENKKIRKSSFNYLDTFVTAWLSAIYRRDMLSAYDIHFPVHMKYKEDVAFLFCAKLVCNSFYLIDDVFYTYYQRQTSVTKAGLDNPRLILDSYRHIVCRLNFLNALNLEPQDYCNVYQKSIWDALQNYYTLYKKDLNDYNSVEEEVLACWFYIYENCQHKELLSVAFSNDFYAALNGNKIKYSKVSVVVPCYNVESYLAECLDSVVNQTLQEIEIICINDGSTDGTLNILQEYAEKDCRIQVIDQDNIGVSKTRNKGINIARGQFVIFMDPDDFYPATDILEILYTKAIENNVLVCGGEFSIFNHITKETTQYFGEDLAGYLFQQDGLIDYKDYQFDYGFHRFIYSKDLLIKNAIYFPNYKRFQDPPFFVKAMFHAKTFYAVNKITYAYREGNVKAKWNKEKIIDLVKGLQDNYKFSKDFHLDNLKTYTQLRAAKHLEDLRGSDELLYKLMRRRMYVSSPLLLLSSKNILKKISKNFFSVTNSSNKEYKVVIILGLKIQLRRRKNHA